MPEALFGVFLLTGAAGGILAAIGHLPAAGQVGIRHVHGGVEHRVLAGDHVHRSGADPVGRGRRILLHKLRGHGLEHPGHVAAAERHPGPAAGAGARHLAHPALGHDARRLADRRSDRPRSTWRCRSSSAAECRPSPASCTSASSPGCRTPRTSTTATRRSKTFPRIRLSRNRPAAPSCRRGAFRCAHRSQAPRWRRDLPRPIRSRTRRCSRGCATASPTWGSPRRPAAGASG